MKPFPQADSALLLRTDFSDQKAWELIRAAVQAPVGMFRFRANLHFVDDEVYRDISKEQILALLGATPHTFIIVADERSMSDSEHPLLIIDGFEKPGRELRSIPSGIQAVENNLSIANMDFEDFTSAADEDGIFRGYR